MAKNSRKKMVVWAGVFSNTRFFQVTRPTAVGDLQLGDQKVTLNHLVGDVHYQIHTEPNRWLNTYHTR